MHQAPGTLPVVAPYQARGRGVGSASSVHCLKRAGEDGSARTSLGLNGASCSSSTKPAAMGHKHPIPGTWHG